MTSPMTAESSSESSGGETQYNFMAVVNLFYKQSIDGQSKIDYVELFKYLVDMPEKAGVMKHRQAICALFKISQDGNYGLNFINHKNLLHILMALAGVYMNCFHRAYIHANYGQILDNFWKQNINISHVQSLLCENFIGVPDAGGSLAKCCGLCECGKQDIDFLVNNCGTYSELWSQFDKKRKNGTNKIVLMIAQIIKNITCRSIKDAQMLACDNTCLRFVILLLYCTLDELRATGWEILLNISRWMIVHRHPLWKTYLEAPFANDELCMSLRRVKIIQKWCETTQNGSDRLRAQKNYEQIKSYVCFHDISLLLFHCAVNNSAGNCTYVLEAIWTLSNVEKSVCNAICSEKSLTSQLFALITWKVRNMNGEEMSSATVSNGINTKANELDVQTPQQRIGDPWKMFLISLYVNEIPNDIELPNNYGNFLGPNLINNDLESSATSSNLNDPNIAKKATIVTKVAQAIIRNLVKSADEGRRTALLYQHQLTLQMEQDREDAFLQWLLTELAWKYI